MRGVILLVCALAVASAAAVGVLALAINILMIRSRRSRELRCPLCQIRDVRASLQRGLADSIYDLFSCVPYRCRSCGGRFYRYMPGSRDTIAP